MSLFLAMADKLEKELLLYCLSTCKFNARETAEAYGMEYRSLLYLMGKHELRKSQGFRPETSIGNGATSAQTG